MNFRSRKVCRNYYIIIHTCNIVPVYFVVCFNNPVIIIGMVFVFSSFDGNSLSFFSTFVCLPFHYSSECYTLSYSDLHFLRLASFFVLRIFFTSLLLCLKDYVLSYSSEFHAYIYIYIYVHSS